MNHQYAGVTFEIGDDHGATGSVTVLAPRRFYRRWALWIALRLWTWATA